MAISEDELNLGRNGFMINPIECGQRLFVQRAHYPDMVLRVQRIDGDQVGLVNLDNHQSLAVNIARLARHGRVGRYRVVDILPPIRQD